MTVWYLLIALALLLANGFFVAAEFALIAARPNKLERLASEGDRKAKIALKSSHEVGFMLAGTQLGITMASLGLGYVAEPAVARLLEKALGFAELSRNVEHTISLVIALTLVVFLHMVVGEMAPKNVAIAEPERTALWLARPYRFYANVFRPFINLLNAVSGAILRLLGVEQKTEAHGVHTSDEIGFMIHESAKGGLLDKFEHRLLAGAVAFGARDAGAVMIPRTELKAIPATITPRAIEPIVVETGHSRFPIYGRDLDHILGFFHAKDLLRVNDGDWDRRLRRALIRRMLVVPESIKLHPLLLEMKRERRHFALVVDEHGGTAGIVTLEDLLEELVGEILDEYDDQGDGIERLAENRWLVPGALRIDEATQRLGVKLPEGEYETVAGFLMDRLGRIPKRADRVEHDGWTLVVRAMQKRRVAQVLVEHVPRPQPNLEEVDP